MINGGLWPTPTDANRRVATGFDAVILPGAGDYQTLERPEEFNRALADVVSGLS